MIYTKEDLETLSGMAYVNFRNRMKRDFFRKDYERKCQCHDCPNLITKKTCQLDHILHRSGFPEYRQHPMDVFFSCGCGSRLDWQKKKMGRLSLVDRIALVHLILPERFTWAREAAKRGLKPDEYERLGG